MNNGEGEIAVRIARKVVDAEASGKKTGHIDVPGTFREKRGAFVTLHTYPENNLRGCIGFPEPIFSLASALVRAAQHACHDPRFPDLEEYELDNVTVEVSILTLPEEIMASDPQSIIDAVRVGIDGLIVEHGQLRGLLLPQVPVEWGWDTKEYLAQTCVKAGMNPDMWLDKHTRLYTFQAEVFSEETPRGNVSRKEIGRCK